MCVCVSVYVYTHTVVNVARGKRTSRGAVTSLASHTGLDCFHLGQKAFQGSWTQVSQLSLWVSPVHAWIRQPVTMVMMMIDDNWRNL